MDKNDICFFVMIPVYKTEMFVRECIDSVLAQTYTNFKVIIVDDGSPDSSGVICDEYAEKDHRITVIHKENGGLISARRAAINKAKEMASMSDFAVFLDSDDSIKPEALSTIYNTITKSEDVDIIVYGMDRVHNGRVYQAFDPNPYIGEVTDKRELYRIVFRGDQYNPLCRKSIRMSIFDNTDYSRYYNLQRGEDLLQSIRLLGNDLQVLHVHDNNGRDDAHAFPFQYDIDWGRFIKGLQEIGYKGCMSLETRVNVNMPEPMRTEMQKSLSKIARFLASQVGE